MLDGIGFSVDVAKTFLATDVSFGIITETLAGIFSILLQTYRIHINESYTVHIAWFFVLFFVLVSLCTCDCLAISVCLSVDSKMLVCGKQKVV